MLKVLLTGASGFLGSTIFETFSDSDVYTLGRAGTSRIICDLSKDEVDLPEVDLVIHAAGKAHFVPKTKEEGMAFFNVNVEGTNRLLKSLEHSGSLPKRFVFISSVAVYGVFDGILVSEEHALLANDPYGLSKVKAEEIINRWCKKNNIICTIFRLPLLLGPNPPGNLKSMIQGIKKGYYFNISGGKARKSMVLLKDVANIIKLKSDVGGIYNLTDGHHPSFAELSLHISKKLGKSYPLNLPKWLVTVMAKAGDLFGDKVPINTKKLMKITANLTYDDSKAREVLGWNPEFVLDAFEV